MGKKRWNIRAIFQYELDSSYRFPTIAVLVSIFLIVGAFSALTHLVWDTEIYSGTDDISGRVDHLTDVVLNMGLSVLITSISNCVLLFIVLIPLLIAFNFAQGYNSGLIRTLLTYPIERKNVILMKACTVVFLVASAASIGSIASVLFFVPVLTQLESMVLVLASIWVLALLMVSVSVLVAVISKSPLVTSFGSIATWFLAFIAVTHPDTPQMLKTTLFPPFAVAEYTGIGPLWVITIFGAEITYADTLVGMGMACLLAIILLGMSYIIFKRTGV